MRGSLAKTWSQSLWLGLSLLSALSADAQQVTWTANFENVGLEVVLDTASPSDARIEVLIRGQIADSLFPVRTGIRD